MGLKTRPSETIVNWRGCSSSDERDTTETDRQNNSWREKPRIRVTSSGGSLQSWKSPDAMAILSNAGLSIAPSARRMCSALGHGFPPCAQRPQPLQNLILIQLEGLPKTFSKDAETVVVYGYAPGGASACSAFGTTAQDTFIDPSRSRLM